jgi:hypothetical protein
LVRPGHPPTLSTSLRVDLAGDARGERVPNSSDVAVGTASSSTAIGPDALMCGRQRP